MIKFPVRLLTFTFAARFSRSVRRTRISQPMLPPFRVFTPSAMMVDMFVPTRPDATK